MKTNFQAKDIQKMLDIPKHRYEYLASKIGITPDIEEVEGQGKTHIYSFRNALQFAFAHKANALGLSPKASREMLVWLDGFEQQHQVGIYGSDSQERLSLHVIIHGDLKFFRVSGDLPEQVVNGIYSSRDMEARFPLGPNELNEFYGEIRDAFKGLEYADGYITINLHSIRKRVVDFAT